MNKTYLIVGGASLVSLAAGGTAGYLVAKRKFDATLDGLIALEVAKTKKHFAILMMEAKSGKPDNPADISREEEDLDEEEQEEELTEADLKAIEKGRATIAAAGKALTDYQGFAKKPDLSDLAGGAIVASNIFSKSATSKKSLPPRGPGGKFVPKISSDDETKREETPQLIDQQTFLLNDGEFDQKNLLYFKSDNTMIDLENNNEVVDNGVVGEVNLTLFDEPDEHGYSAIYVRNEWMETDYEIRLMTESLTSYLGLGTEDDETDFDENDAAEHALAHGYEE